MPGPSDPMARCFPEPTPFYTEARARAAGRLAAPEELDPGFDRAGWAELAAFDFFRMPFAEENGGLGLASDDLCDVLEGLGAGSANTSLLFAAGAHLWAVAKPVVDYGSPEQKERYLPSLLAGESIGAHAASEPDAGSDVMSMQTRYLRDGDGFVLDGSKMWVTNAPQADLFVAFATSDPRLHFRGISAFLIERDTPGLTVGPAEKKMGLQGAPLAQVFFDGCRVPASALLGKERRGAALFQTSLTWERTFIQGPQIGAMRRQIERAVEYARERRQFGRAIAGYQAVSHRIVDMLRRYWEARLVLRMAGRQLAEADDATFAPLAKLVLAETALGVHMDGMRTFGGLGYMWEMGIEGDVRDALGGTIYSGTSDLQRNMLADALGL